MTRWTAADVRRLSQRQSSTRTGDAAPKPATSRARATRSGDDHAARYEQLVRHEIVRAAGARIGLPNPVAEHRFVAGRGFRLDFAWPQQRIGLEIDGGIYRRDPSHSSIGGQLRDLEKNNFWTERGWRVFRLTPDQLKKGRLLEHLVAMRAQLGALA